MNHTYYCTHHGLPMVSRLPPWLPAEIPRLPVIMLLELQDPTTLQLFCMENVEKKSSRCGSLSAPPAERKQVTRCTPERWLRFQPHTYHHPCLVQRACAVVCLARLIVLAFTNSVLARPVNPGHLWPKTDHSDTHIDGDKPNLHLDIQVTRVSTPTPNPKQTTHA